MTNIQIGAITNIGLLTDEEEPTAEVSARFRRKITTQALKDEADGKLKPYKSTPEEWGL